MGDDRGISYGRAPAILNAAEFANSRAYVIGINAYQNGIPQLRTAVADADRLGKLLKESHGYAVLTLPQNAAPTLETLRDLLHKKMLQEVGPNDRVLFYFAGHGIALDGDDGPEGYLVPQDATRDDRGSFLPMTELSDALSKLPCRHLLLILDCCFAGAFRWSSTRDLSSLPSVIHRERYERYIQDPAWQVLTSAAYDQTALDVLSGSTIGERIETADHSPFAAALFRALAGEADLIPRGKDGKPGGDGVITATELYLYLRECVETATVEQRTRQTPGLWPLKKHDKGEYILLTPEHELNLPPAPELNYKNNPYRGLQSFEMNDREVFFGRSKQVRQLHRRVVKQPLTVVLGASGTGKSSLVKAGYLSRLRQRKSWCVMQDDGETPIVIRPGKSPLATLASLVLPGEDRLANLEDRLAVLLSDKCAFANRINAWAEAHPGVSRLLLTVDQFEELVTLSVNNEERMRFVDQLAFAVNAMPDRFRLVVTLRSDFEPQFSDCALKSHWIPSRYVVPAMSTDDLREAIEGPASVRVLYFQPAELVDRLIDEVIQTPGAMPLLSFTLSELYVRYIERRGDDRCLTLSDFERLGGVAGSLRSRATELYDNLEGPHQTTMRRIMLRMVSIQGGEPTRRRISKLELVYPNHNDNERVAKVLHELSHARLIVEGMEADGERYVEPSHDALVRGWFELLEWGNSAREELTLRHLLTPAADDWRNNKGGTWRTNPRLAQLTRICQSHDSWLNQAEEAFVRRSEQLRRRYIVTTILFVSVTIVTLLLATVSAMASRANAHRQASKAFWQLAIEARNEHLDVTSAFNFLSAADASAQAGDDVASLNAELAGQLATSSLVRSFLHEAPTNDFCFSTDETRILTWCIDGTVTLWDIGKSDPIVAWKHEASVEGAIFSRDESQVLSWSKDGSVRLWSISQNEPLIEWVHSGTVVGATFSKDESRVLAWGDGSFDSSGNSGEIRVWSINQPDPLQLWKHDSTIRDTPLRVWKHNGDVDGAMFLGDESRVIAWSDDGAIKLWHVDSNLPLKEWNHGRAVNGIALSRDESRLITWSDDKYLRLWAIAEESPLQSWQHDCEVWGASFTNDESRVLTWGGKRQALCHCCRLP